MFHVFLLTMCKLCTLTTLYDSDSPLNAEAAELWDKDPEEFKRKVLARHRDVDDD